MEWLSHSQKKHCELCKTAFRFTKLYAHDMPKTVPFYVFLSHMAKYIFRNILVWARGALVLMVWLVWLPYLMRRVWSALFWLSDEGLGPVFGRPGATSALTSSPGLPSGAATCAASPLLEETRTAANLQSVMSQIPRSSTSQMTTSLYGINITTDNPLSNILLNMFLGSFYMAGAISRDDTPVAAQSVAAPTPIQHPSLLSDVKFLQKLSASSPTLGGFAIDVLEGQIITILVIICFILIILVRDYVVQQQPDINMRAALLAAAGNPAPADDDVVMAEAPAIVQLDPTEGLGPEDIDRLPGPEQEDDGMSVQAVDGDAEPQGAPWPSALVEEFAEVDNRPESAIEDVFPRDTPRQPTLSDRGDGEPGPAEKYVSLYREAHGDPDRIRRLAHERNLEGELAYFLNIGHGKSEASRRQGDVPVNGGESSRDGRPAPSWDWPGDEAQESGKGKSPMTSESIDTGGDQNPTSRPRSATDGPQRTGGINPLGHNNWSFSEASHEGQRADTQFSTVSGASAAGPVTDVTAPASHWNYMTPPSSTLAESASSSSHARTPSSSDNDELAHSPVGLPQQASTNVEMQSGQAEDWETISELNGQLGPQQNVEVPAEDPGVRERPRPAGFAQRVADFMWRDVDAIPPHELPPLQDAADDFFDHEQDAALVVVEDPVQQPQERDQEVMAAAAAAGIDAEAEAIEDAEDLEGILELLGMRGPIAGLFQNALFCAFLVSITLFLGIFVPYNLGRISIWVAANPIRPLRMVFSFSKSVQDMAMVMVGFVSTLIFGCLNGILSLIRPDAPQPEMIGNLVQTSWTLMENAAGRLRDGGLADFSVLSGEEIRNFSIVSHEALLTLKNQVAMLLAAIGETVLFIVGGDYSAKLGYIISWTNTALHFVWQCLKDLPTLVSIPSSWVIDLGSSGPARPLNLELMSWSAMDRVWAILGGYVAMCVTAALYLGRGTPIAGRFGQEWEATLIDILVQASGVMKVILIIGIEMLIFPLYCGLLLDIALLPLFENTTIMSRMMFTVNYPLTSIFVHWFVGTGYMFHFALFVSMCRKIMRKGVLCKSLRSHAMPDPTANSSPDFIRDPDDAEFHPVRDVLERNVTTQLRKILFSAFVYGALVIVCLGGVVWALSYGFQNVLPIYYSSNEPVLEFPIDLLFYNFLMPLAVRFYRPSDGLHTMYTWWFRKLARALRLTWFLFGERKVDEEGTLQMGNGSAAQLAPWWKTLLLEVDGQDVVPKTWKDTFDGGHSKPALPLSSDNLEAHDRNKDHLLKSGQLIPDGRFVRAPASDQVKIPKGQRVFFEVDEHNERPDGKPDRSATDLYSTNSYQFVYVPPNFRFRIFLFIFFIWLFAAATGVGFTIIPLVFGRAMFRLFIPADVRTNDIYAFSIGLYILGSVFYFAFRIKDTYLKVNTWARNTASNLLDQETLQRAAAITTRAAKLVYAYFFLLVVFPFMVSSLMELYLLIPLDTYMYGAATVHNTDAAVLPRHTVRVMQSWTIGVIYLKLAARFVVHWYQDSRLAAATRAILRHGWLEPDVKVLTRAFVVPGLSLWLAAVFGPLMLARTAIRYTAGPEQADKPDSTTGVLIYRFCFAAALLCAVGFAVMRGIFGVFRSWRVRIKDEAYLIGERLHNFSSPPQVLGERERERRRTRVGWE